MMDPEKSACGGWDERSDQFSCCCRSQWCWRCTAKRGGPLCCGEACKEEGARSKGRMQPTWQCCGGAVQRQFLAMNCQVVSKAGGQV